MNYNPDVLSCLANLSSDEVFTPPHIANQMIDLLPEELWSDKNTAFLDPATKSGVFLREITKRLMAGLKKEIPDMQERVNHIMANQLFGIGITELTSLLARRSVYCSKHADGKFSTCSEFEDKIGNIYFDRIEHEWKNGKCKFCGTSQQNYHRDGTLETHAYQFIHGQLPERIKNMKFDVIIGNPPYQLGDGGYGASAAPIYHQFVQQAMQFNPRFLSMIIPARWYAGGRVGDLTHFRGQMLKDHRIRELNDFISSSDCFPGVEIKGGVCYFLWNRDNPGKCLVKSHEGKGIISECQRFLLEDDMDTFVRINESIPILKKVSSLSESSFNGIVSANDPFGFDVRQEGSMRRVKPSFELHPSADAIPFYYNGWRQKGLGYIKRTAIRKNKNWLEKIKLFVPKAIGSGDTRTDQIKPFEPEQISCCGETYIVVGPFKSQKELENSQSYMETKFFHFLVGLKKNTQEARRSVYELVPIQDFSRPWTDEDLFKKYQLTKAERQFINTYITF